VAPAPQLVRGRHVVAHNNLHGDVLNMGVVEDGDLITGRSGGVCHLFARAIINRLAG
jgi:protease I